MKIAKQLALVLFVLLLAPLAVFADPLLFTYLPTGATGPVLLYADSTACATASPDCVTNKVAATVPAVSGSTNVLVAAGAACSTVGNVAPVAAPFSITGLSSGSFAMEVVPNTPAIVIQPKVMNAAPHTAIVGKITTPNGHRCALYLLAFTAN
jgi:hypothetical protein